MFRRPKKPVRPRLIITDDPGNDEDDNDMDFTVTPIKVEAGQDGKKSSKDKEILDIQPKSSSLLSFNEEEDGGETFQVKKSSVSRRLMKQRERGKKPKKPNTESDSKIHGNDGKNENNADETFLRILVGREAEAVDMESGSEDEGETRINFRPRTDNVSEELRRTLDSDGIPDANLIHEVRKRRQLARDLGGYIPLDDGERYFQFIMSILK